LLYFSKESVRDFFEYFTPRILAEDRIMNLFGERPVNLFGEG